MVFTESRSPWLDPPLEGPGVKTFNPSTPQSFHFLCIVSGSFPGPRIALRSFDKSVH